MRALEQLEPAAEQVGSSDGQENQGSGGGTHQGVASYGELKYLIKQAGLLDGQPAFFTYKISLTLALLGMGVGVVVMHPPLWLLLLDAAFLAIVFTQIGFLLHDVCHRAVSRGGRRSLLYGLLFGNLITGISRAWWTENHNAHHSHPNEIDADPNIDIPILAYTEDQALTKRGVARFIVAYQAYFLFPIFCLQGFNMLIQSVVFLWHSGDARTARTEAPVLVLHYLLYGGLLYSALGLWGGLLFMLVHQGLIGLYAGSVFAPNHKGMPILAAGAPIGFLQRQVLTSRNVVGHPVIDFWYGGLNYQIEHHLFPAMPRNNLGRAQVIVRVFCADHGIAYHETGMLASYAEILKHFAAVSAVLRTTALPRA